MTAVDLFVNGTLMRGLALHANLAAAEFLEACQTAPRYRLYSIGDVHPGMFEVESGGISVPGELYRVPAQVLEQVEAGEPPNLYRGPVHLSDGRTVQGILYPRLLAEHRRPADDGPNDPTVDAHSLVHDGRAGGAGMEVGDRNPSLRPGIVDADIGVAPDCDRPLPREEPEAARG